VCVCTQPCSDGCGIEGIQLPEIPKNLGMTFTAALPTAEMFLLSNSCLCVMNSCLCVINSKGAFCFCQTSTEIHEKKTNDCSRLGVRGINSVPWSPPLLQSKESIKLSQSLKEEEKL